MRRLLEDPGLRAAYVAAVTEAMAVAAGRQLARRRAGTRQYALVHDAALADTFKLATNEEFEQAFADLIAFARTRPAFVERRARAAAVESLRRGGSEDPRPRAVTAA